VTPDAALLRVLYNPVGWADPAWLTHFNLGRDFPPRLGNTLLLARANVQAITSSELELPCVPWLVAHWAVIAPAVYLVGARLARNALVNANALPHLRYGADRFVTLPLTESLWRQAWCQNGAVSGWRGDMHARVWAAGLCCLNGAWRNLPPGWLDRLRLRLPPEVQADVDGISRVLPASGSCVRLFDQAITFHHAQNH